MAPLFQIAIEAPKGLKKYVSGSQGFIALDASAPTRSLIRHWSAS
jgi:hypothetical protein